MELEIWLPPIFTMTSARNGQNLSRGRSRLSDGSETPFTSKPEFKEWTQMCRSLFVSSEPDIAQLTTPQRPGANRRVRESVGECGSACTCARARPGTRLTGGLPTDPAPTRTSTHQSKKRPGQRMQQQKEWDPLLGFLYERKTGSTNRTSCQRAVPAHQAQPARHQTRPVVRRAALLLRCQGALLAVAPWAHTS